MNPVRIDLQNNYNKIKEMLKHDNKLDAMLLLINTHEKQKIKNNQLLKKVIN